MPWPVSARDTSVGKAKGIHVEPIRAAAANALVRRVHYSGKVVNNSQLHLGVFREGRLEGVMQFGPSLDKRKLIGLVAGTSWNGFIELNRMAFAETLPRNSESRALGVAMRMLRRAYPHLEWVLSFADGCQCGDGTIYRAAGFVLTDIRPNRGLWRMPDGRVVHKMNFEAARVCGEYAGEKKDPSASATKHLRGVGAEPVAGFQLRYVFFVNPAARERLTVPAIPFAKIREMGVGMYRGNRVASV